jgi:hypothetical protein
MSINPSRYSNGRDVLRWNPFERPVDEAFADRLEEVLRRERLDPEQHDIGVRPRRSAV